jgi:uncharacterized membrane protein YeaQ/YmgE (transglycosylase-associated protein family)
MGNMTGVGSGKRLMPFRRPLDGTRAARWSRWNGPQLVGSGGAQPNPSMTILGTILIGLLVGAVAKLVMPGKDPGGIIVTILIGIAGAFVARYLGQGIGWYGPNDAAGFIASVIGAMLLLLLYRLLFRGRRT